MAEENEENTGSVEDWVEKNLDWVVQSELNIADEVFDDKFWTLASPLEFRTGHREETWLEQNNRRKNAGRDLANVFSPKKLERSIRFGEPKDDDPPDDAT